MNQDALEQLAAELGPRWPSRKAAWLDGWREAQQHDRLTGAVPHPEGEGALRELLSWVEQSAEDEDKLAETDGEGLQVEAAEAARVFRDVATHVRSLLPEEEK